MMTLLKEEARFNNICLRVEDVKEVKLLIGGTRMSGAQDITEHQGETHGGQV
jgi:hypothetical protein